MDGVSRVFQGLFRDFEGLSKVFLRSSIYKRVGRDSNFTIVLVCRFKVVIFAPCIPPLDPL
jgi:hypothetical protein